jgi:thiol-disulfide isomerase/thioredoxin
MTKKIIMLGTCLCLALGAALFSQATPSSPLEQALQQHKGEVIYLDFWASWCGPCRKSFPWMNSLQKELKDKGFTVISVNVDAMDSAAEEFLQQVPAHFTIIKDPKGEFAKQYQLKGMPSSFLINRQGDIVSSHVGFSASKKKEYEQEIRALLKKS